MGQRRVPDPTEEGRARLRLLMAAAALFILIAGLTLLTFLVLRGDSSAKDAMIVFFPFFLTGLLLFAASAFIDSETVKLFINAASPIKSGGK